MIYQDHVEADVVNILTYINDFTQQLGIPNVQVSTAELLSVCLGMRRNFPHVDGLTKASTFKKVANFVAWFVSVGPIKSHFPADSIRGLDGTFNANAVIAFDIALFCLDNSQIATPTGNKTISKQIYVSDHSYADIICALSQDNLSPETHFHLLAVFFEQLTYKSNRQCEYGQDGNNLYYPYTPFHMDDMTGV